MQYPFLKPSGNEVCTNSPFSKPNEPIQSDLPQTTTSEGKLAGSIARPGGQSVNNREAVLNNAILSVADDRCISTIVEPGETSWMMDTPRRSIEDVHGSKSMKKVKEDSNTTA